MADSRGFLMPTASMAFQQYAWFSVQVDQYYAAIRIFARHYGALRAAYQHLPTHEAWPSDLSCLSEPAATFFMMCSSALNYMGTTQIFAEAPFAQLEGLPTDLVNFGFYTCFCFQWTLFENFVKDAVFGLVAESLLAPDIAGELHRRTLRTKAFLQYIDEGRVFGHTPFTTILPIVGWSPKTETCNSSDLDRIRDLRNEFIHAVESRSILPSSEVEKERLYERSMWILRQFAGNVDLDVQRMRTKSELAPGTPPEA